MMFRVKSSGPPKEEVIRSRPSCMVEFPIEACDVMRDAIAGSSKFELWYLVSWVVESSMKRAVVFLGSRPIVPSRTFETRCYHSCLHEAQ
jgi:hypothetical protein